MRLLSKEQFIEGKTSDTIFVLGCGWSIRRVSKEDWGIIDRYDSISFNWFALHDFEPTFFLIREQANLPHRKGKGETIKTLISRVNRYKKTRCIMCDVRRHTPKAYAYHKDKRLTASGIVVKDDKDKRHFRKLHRYFRRDPFKYGLIHGRCTMYNVLHMVTFLQYKRVVFVGVDLYNSRYFWLDKRETRHSVAKKGRSFKHKHFIAADMMRLIKRYKKVMPEMYVVGRKSLLARRIPAMSIKDLHENILQR